MNLKQAILSAASHIEQYPDSYNFIRGAYPRNGRPGCMLAWIGVYFGLQEEDVRGDYSDHVARLLGHANWKGFLHELRVLMEGLTQYEQDAHWFYHRSSGAVLCLRLYAKAHFPTPGMPASVRAIFEQKCPLPEDTAIEVTA